MKTKIAFDFDRVFVNYPPFIPSTFIEYLYKRRNHKLSYRIPGHFEQQIRTLSHMPLLRPAIRSNIETLKKIFDQDKFLIYLISSRFSFLRDRTNKWTKKNGISKYFEKMYFNFNDEQPHLFKDRIIKQEKISKFIDDDLDLLTYLAKENPKVDFYWLDNTKRKPKLMANIWRIRILEEFLKYV